MQYFAMTVQEKMTLESQGHKCKGTHNVRDLENKPTGAVKWEFDLPEEIKDKAKEAIVDAVPVIDKIATKEAKQNKQYQEESKGQPKKRGNPNWIKRNK